jgi:hypothetical protein
VKIAALLLIPLTFADAATDARFGLVGTGGKAFAHKFGLAYYALEGNYPASGNVFSSVDPANDPAAGFKVLRKVAKLNVRNDTLGQTNAQFESALGTYATNLAGWHAFHNGAKPTFTWHAPDAAALSAAESLQIATTIRREKTLVPAVTGTVWEIGNEPNLFPALLPAHYAAIYTRYHRIIKQEDPAAKVALGPVFAREVAMDLLPRMREIQRQTLTQRGLGQPGQPLFDSVDTDLWNTYSSRVLNLGTVEYFAQVLAALDTSVRPDVVSLHVYPFDDRAPSLGATQIRKTLDSLADTLGARFQARGASPALWITEFGNIDPNLNEQQVAARTDSLINGFEAGARCAQWFYYKATGADQQLAGVPGLGLPLTRLANDADFSPADGNFACGNLNAIGRLYYARANGEACREKLRFAAASSSFGLSDIVGPPHSIPVRLPRAEVDTVRVSVAASGGTLTQGTNYTFSPSILVFAPGDTSRSITLNWTASGGAYQPGTIVFTLRDPVNAAVSADSMHTLTFTGMAGAVLPGIPGAELSLDPLRGALVFSLPRDTDLSLRLYDLAGKTRGNLRLRLKAGVNVVPLRDAARGGKLPAGIYSLQVSGPRFVKTFPIPWLDL